MRVTQSALLAAAFAKMTLAGTLCLSYSFLSLGGDTSSSGRFDFFPIQGNPCEDAEKLFDSDDTEDSFCDKLRNDGGIGFHVCGQDGNIVLADDGSPFPIGRGAMSDCGVRIELGGDIFGGRVAYDGQEDCYGTCGDLIGHHYNPSVIFEDVPFCAPADPIDWS